MYHFYKNLVQAKPCTKKILMVMKLTTLIMVMAIMHVSAVTLGQKISLSVKNAPLAVVFDQISDQTGYDFAFSSTLIKNAKPVTIVVKDGELADVLKQIFSNQPLAYEVENQTVVIKPLTTFPAMVSKPVSTTANSMSGIVTDSLGKPIAGATVKLRPGDFITATNKLGLFTFKDLPSGGYTLSITSVGFQPLQMDIEINESTKASLTAFVLKETISSLNEVLINTGYQRIKPEQSTGATTRISTKDYESRISTDFLSGLANKLTGVLINNDVTFEGNGLFQVRGLSTINGNKSPLIVIDGYPTELSLDMINPNEIKSVTVLKDAAAATIYGVRASNGVVIVERKDASEGKPRIDFRTTFSFRPKENYNRYRWDKDGSATVVDYQLAVYGGIGTTWAQVINPTPAVGRQYNYPAPVLTNLQQKANIITADQAQQQYNALKSYNNASDYTRLFLQNAVTQSYNLNLSGGNKNALYYITTNYTTATQQQKKNDNDQLLLSGRSNLIFSNRFSLDFTTDFSLAHSNAAAVPDINNFYPYEHFQDGNGNPVATFNGSGVTPQFNQALIKLGLQDNLYYPLVNMNEVGTSGRTMNNRITANFIYKMGDGLNLNFGGVYENSNFDSRNLASSLSSVARQFVNEYAQPSTATSTGIAFNIPAGGYLQENTSNTSSYTARAQLNFNKRLGKNHSLNAIVGGEMRDVRTQGSNMAYFGYNDQTLIQLPVNYQVIAGAYSPFYVSSNPKIDPTEVISQLYTDNRFMSGYSNVVYSFKDRYSLTGSIRVDQSNLFGTDPKYKYKPLWSLGAAWNIHQESFMQDFGWLKQLKLRAAYGFNGNVAKQSLPQVIAKAAVNFNFPIGSQGLPMLTLLSYANSGLRWEQTQNFNIGLDYSLFKNIYGSIDVYEKKSTDLLANTQIDATRGGSSALTNTASIRNRGLEVSLRADWITRKHFNWNTGLIFSYDKSKTLAVYNNTITDGAHSTAYVAGSNANYLKGYPVGALFAYNVVGVDNTGVPLIKTEDGSVRRFPLSDNEDQGKKNVYYAGTTIPPVNIGLSNRVDVGRFYFYCMINYYGGFVTRIPSTLPSANRPVPGANNYWRQAGDENKPGILPSLGFLQSIGQYGTYFGSSSLYTLKGDYISLGDVTASYNFGNMPFLKKSGFTNFEVKLQATNVYTHGFNKYNYSPATGSFYKPYITPTYTIALFTKF